MLKRKLASYSRLLRFRKETNSQTYKAKALLAETHYSHDHRKLFSTNARKFVLGIETSCDDTGAAVVDDTGTILGDALHSQTSVHVELGGILPVVARDMHEEHVDRIVNEALDAANLTVTDLDAIAVTVKPGMPLSLAVGLNYAKKLVRESRVPMIPIHHMEAHALTARLLHKIDFPFLVLLASGGHCLLAVARDVEDFLLLGNCLDTSPGDTFDKTARQLKLKNLPQCAEMSGGAAIELLAADGDPHAFPGPTFSAGRRDCHFSFSGIRQYYQALIEKEEAKQGIVGEQVLPNVADICANFQHTVLRQISMRLQRALLFCEYKDLLPENKVLVVSGGVASNKYLLQGLETVCQPYDCQVICPPPHLCTDNGIMIAWNGMEKLLAGRGIAAEPDSVTYSNRAPLGKDISTEVVYSSIKLPKQTPSQS